MNEKLNLSKQVVLNLAKSKGIEAQKANVVLCLDFSGSMSGLYAKGFVQAVLERIVPIAMAFDDDGALDVYIFNHEAYRVLPAATSENIKGYIKQYIEGKYTYGSTAYAPPIDMITRAFTKATGADEQASVASKIGSFFGFGVKKQEIKQITADLPTLVLFITDGENDADDKGPAQKAIVDASKHGIMWQFIGLKSGGSTNFSFLKKLDKMEGRFIDNASFFEITDEDMVTKSDNDFYNLLLNEYPAWTKEAAQKGLIAPVKDVTVTQ
jgi:hypothetical protein